LIETIDTRTGNLDEFERCPFKQLGAIFGPTAGITKASLVFIKLETCASVGT
jgi:hypothetical protein